MSAGAPEIVIAGNLLVDDIVLRDGRTLMGEPGGAVLHAALAAALWGARVGVVGVLGTDYPPAAIEALTARRIDTAGLRPSGATSLRTWLLYEHEARRVVHQLGSPSHEAVSPSAGDVPAAWWEAAIVHVAPMPRTIQLGFSAHAARERTVDPHEPLVPGGGDHGVERFAGFDGVFVSHEELRLPGDLREQAEGVPAARFVAIKRAGAGGWLLDRAAGRTFEWAARATRVVDTTGAGDAFAAGFLVGRLRGGSIEACCARGVVSASFALEDWGARGLLAADRDAAERRLLEWYGAAAAERPARHGASPE
jgi:ribokinase